jgi:hypothetical protein
MVLSVLVSDLRHLRSVCEAERCESPLPWAMNREPGEEVLSINIHEVNILLSNLTPYTKTKGLFCILYSLF